MTLKLPTARELATYLLRTQNLVARWTIGSPEADEGRADVNLLERDLEKSPSVTQYLIRPRKPGTLSDDFDVPRAQVDLVRNPDGLRPEDQQRYLVPGYIVSAFMAVDPTITGDKVLKVLMLLTQGSVFSVTAGTGFDEAYQGRQLLESLVEGERLQTTLVPPLIWDNTNPQKASVVMVHHPYSLDFRERPLQELGLRISEYTRIQKAYTAEMEQRIARTSPASELR